MFEVYSILNNISMNLYQIAIENAYGLANRRLQNFHLFHSTFGHLFFYFLVDLFVSSYQK